MTCAQELRKGQSTYTNTVRKLFIFPGTRGDNEQKNEALANVANTKYAMDMLPCLKGFL